MAATDGPASRCSGGTGDQGGRKRAREADPASSTRGPGLGLSRTATHPAPRACSRWPPQAPARGALVTQQRFRHEPCPRGDGVWEHLLSTTALTRDSQRNVIPSLRSAGVCAQTAPEPRAPSGHGSAAPSCASRGQTQRCRAPLPRLWMGVTMCSPPCEAQGAAGAAGGLPSAAGTGLGERQPRLCLLLPKAPVLPEPRGPPLAWGCLRDDVTLTC